MPTAASAELPSAGAATATGSSATAAAGTAAAGTAAGGTAAGGVVPLSGRRVFASRARTPLGAAVRTVQVAGVAGVPVSGATAVLLTLEATAPTAGAGASAAVTVWTAGRRRPAAPGLVVAAGRTRATSLLVALDAHGRLALAGDARLPTSVVLQVTGYLSGPATGSGVLVATPARRVGTLAAGMTPRSLVVGGRPGVPAAAAAVVLALHASAPGASRVFLGPAGADVPGTPSLVVAGPQDSGDTLAVVPLGAGGGVALRALGAPAAVTATTVGYLTGGPATGTGAYVPMTPSTLRGTAGAGAVLPAGRPGTFGLPPSVPAGAVGVVLAVATTPVRSGAGPAAPPPSLTLRGTGARTALAVPAGDARLVTTVALGPGHTIAITASAAMRVSVLVVGYLAPAPRPVPAPVPAPTSSEAAQPAPAAPATPVPAPASPVPPAATPTPTVPPTGVPAATVTSLDGYPSDRRIVLNAVTSNPGAELAPHDRAVVRVANSGTAPLTISSASAAITTPAVQRCPSNDSLGHPCPPDRPAPAAAFTVSPPPDGPLAPGASVDLTVTYAATAAPNPSYYTSDLAVLRIVSDDPAVPVHTLELAGLREISGGAGEPSVHDLVLAFGWGTRVPATGTTADVQQALPTGGDTLAAARTFVAAGPAPTEVREAVSFGPLPSSLTLSAVTSTGSTTLLTRAEGQSTSTRPLTVPGTASIGGGARFALQAEVQASRLNPSRRVAATDAQPAAWRVFPLREGGGALVPHAYLVCYDEPTATTGNSDFQDEVFVLTGVIALDAAGAPVG